MQENNWFPSLVQCTHKPAARMSHKPARGGKVLSPVPRPVFLLAQENSPQAYRKSYTQCLLVHVPFIRESKLTHKPQHRKKTSKITELKELKTLLLKLSVEVHRAELLKVMTKNMVP